MKAIRFLGQKKIVVEDVPDPVAQGGEANVKIKASALCRSDLSIYHGSPVLDKKEAGKVIPGHEPCGVVEEVGKDVNRDYLEPGDKVAIYLAIGCGQCIYCKSGYMMLCKNWKCIGFDVDGGHAEYIKIPANNCLKLPPEMDFMEGALSTDKFGTLYHAQKRVGVSGRDKVAIFGMGPMGEAGVMVAKALNATVIAIDVLDERLIFAKEIGADYMVNGSQCNVLEAISEITRGEGVDVAIDCSGNSKGEKDALSIIKPFGQVVYIGENKEVLINPSDQLIRKEAMLLGSWYFPIWEFEEIAQFIVRKKVPLKKMVTHTFKFRDAARAYEMFDKRLTGAVLLVNND